MRSSSWFNIRLLVLVIICVIVAVDVALIVLLRRRPPGRAVAVAMRSRKLWERANLIAVGLIVLAFAILMVVNNRWRW